MSQTHRVCRVSELLPGLRKIVESLPVTTEAAEPGVETYPVEAGDGCVVVHV